MDDRLRPLLAARDEDTLELAAMRGLDRLRNDLAALSGPSADEAVERWIVATPDALVSRWRQYYDEQIVPRVFGALRPRPSRTHLARKQNSTSLGRALQLDAWLGSAADVGGSQKECRIKLEEAHEQGIEAWLIAA